MNEDSEREDTRANPIGPFTRGSDLRVGDVVHLRNSGVDVRIVERGDGQWRAEVIDEFVEEINGRTLPVFFDDKYVLVEKGS